MCSVFIHLNGMIWPMVHMRSCSKITQILTFINSRYSVIIVISKINITLTLICWFCYMLISKPVPIYCSVFRIVNICCGCKRSAYLPWARHPRLCIAHGTEPPSRWYAQYIVGEDFALGQSGLPEPREQAWPCLGRLRTVYECVWCERGLSTYGVATLKSMKFEWGGEGLVDSRLASGA